MVIRGLIIVLGLTFLSQPVHAQVKDYARFVVNTLASDSLFGRGYVNDGDKKAAEFIEQQFRDFGVLPLNNRYRQTFSIPVNTFPDSIFLAIDGRELEVGTDFHVLPGSPSISGVYDLIFISKEEIFDLPKLQSTIDKAEDKILVIDEYPDSLMDNTQRNVWVQIQQFLTRHPNNKAEATILLTNEKLTWYGSQIEDSNPSIRLHKDVFDPTSKTVEIKLENEFFNSYSTQNVFGFIEGDSDSTLLFMAHYDHFGMMGQAIFPGANDNASGVAMLLSLARHYSNSDNKPPHNIVFVAFGAEELGLIGAKHFAENPPYELSKTKFMLNFDISGTGDDGIRVVNGSVYRTQFDQLVELNENYELLPQVRIRGSACNSDHCIFDRLNIPGFYIYTLGGIPAYHDVYDRPETLPLTEFEDYFRLMTLFVDGL
jgi:hypothetical protein